MHLCVYYHFEFLLLPLQILFKIPCLSVVLILNQNTQEMQNSTTSDFKCSKRNLTHVDIRLLGLQYTYARLALLMFMPNIIVTVTGISC